MAMLPQPVPSAARLADLVRRDGVPGTGALDPSLCVEAIAQRSGRVEPLGKQAVPEPGAAVRAGTALSVPVCSSWRARLVDPHLDGCLASGAVFGGPAASKVSRNVRVATRGSSDADSVSLGRFSSSITAIETRAISWKPHYGADRSVDGRVDDDVQRGLARWIRRETG